MRTTLAPRTRVQYLHLVHAYNTCTLYMHTTLAPRTCVQHLHFIQAYNTCTSYTHATLAPHTHMQHLHLHVSSLLGSFLIRDLPHQTPHPSLQAAGPGREKYHFQCFSSSLLILPTLDILGFSSLCHIYMYLLAWYSK